MKSWIIILSLLALIALLITVDHAVSSNCGDSVKMQTVGHDGHLYVVVTTENGQALIHSPTCKCKELPE